MNKGPELLRAFFSRHSTSDGLTDICGQRLPSRFCRILNALLVSFGHVKSDCIIMRRLVFARCSFMRFRNCHRITSPIISALYQTVTNNSTKISWKVLTYITDGVIIVPSDNTDGDYLKYAGQEVQANGGMQDDSSRSVKAGRLAHCSRDDSRTSTRVHQVHCYRLQERKRLTQKE